MNAGSTARTSAPSNGPSVTCPSIILLGSQKAFGLIRRCSSRTISPPAMPRRASENVIGPRHHARKVREKPEFADNSSSKPGCRMNHAPHTPAREIGLCGLGMPPDEHWYHFVRAFFIAASSPIPINQRMASEREGLSGSVLRQ